ncbi:MAG: hypothetical protein QOG54_353 [Actinomycetota bacterium]|nr:hypothetical protein [Actinomycetota bacterium]
MAEEEYWNRKSRRKHYGQITIRLIRQEGPIVVDFDYECWLAGETAPLAHLFWNEDDGSIRLERFREGHRGPTNTETVATGVSSANAGYAQVEDWLDEESFWDTQKQKREGTDGEQKRAQTSNP